MCPTRRPSGSSSQCRRRASCVSRRCWFEPAANPSQTSWVRSRGMSLAETQKREWSSTPVSALAAVPSASRKPPTTSICQSSMGSAALPALPGLLATVTCHRLDHPGPDQAAVHRRLRRRRLHLSPEQFEHQASGAPVPMRPPQLEHQRLDGGRHLVWAGDRLVRPIAKPFQASCLISRQPAMHRAPVHSPLESHVGDAPTLADDRQHCRVPLLSHAHVPHARDCDQSAEAVGTSQPKVCDTSAEALQRRVNRTFTVSPSRRGDSNSRPAVYETAALPLSYVGGASSLPRPPTSSAPVAPGKR
jgi:hypothetical protein